MQDYDTITFDDVAGLLAAFVAGLTLATSVLLLML